jgi:hypothetical protein
MIVLPQVVEKFPILYGTQAFFIIFQWSLLYEPVESSPDHTCFPLLTSFQRISKCVNAVGPHNFKAEGSPLISCAHPLIQYACSYRLYSNAKSLVCKLKVYHVMVVKRLLDSGRCHYLNTQLFLSSSKLPVHYKLQNIFLTSGMK